MKKVFIVHGYKSSPNSGWRPWLMDELNKKEIYACALAMPDPWNPIRKDWIEEIARHIDRNPEDEIYLVGHSLGVSAILRYLETSKSERIMGAVLVAGPCENIKPELVDFLGDPFDFAKIKSAAKQFTIIHGDNDDRVPLTHGEKLSRELDGPLTVIPGGGHLNEKKGWNTLPAVLEALSKMLGSTEDTSRA